MTTTCFQLDAESRCAELNAMATTDQGAEVMRLKGELLDMDHDLDEAQGGESAYRAMVLELKSTLAARQLTLDAQGLALKEAQDLLGEAISTESSISASEVIEKIEVFLAMAIR